MNRSKFNSLLIGFIILISLTVFTQKQPDYVKLNTYVQNSVDSFVVPGLAVGIIKNGEIVFAKGFGIRSNENDVKVDTETSFGIASLSKAFTAISIGMLHYLIIR